MFDRQAKLVVIVIAAWLVIGAAWGVSRLWAPRPDATGAAARNCPFVASINRDKFHRADCRHARRIPDSALLGFDDRETAIACGLSPCKVCKP